VETPRADGMDDFTLTFSKDREFCEAMAVRHPKEIGRLLVYLGWAQNCLNPIQLELNDLVRRHFDPAVAREAGFWTVTLIGGVYKDLALVPYLAIRGLLSEAGVVVRRSLEHVGVLAHLWYDPSKATLLSDPESGAFRNAFVSEADKRKAADLKAAGLQKRFAQCMLGKAASGLYRILSSHTVHGGSPTQVVGEELAPTRLSCMFVNRPDPLEKDLRVLIQVLGQGCELLCAEIAFIHATYAKQYKLPPSKAGKGGYFLSTLIETVPDGGLAAMIDKTLMDLGWSPTPQ
jgi:hypothetical protein